MRSIRFTKMAATGNDFIVVDNRNLRFSSGLSGLAERLCDRKRGIGADGLLVLERSRPADFRMRIFNPDGSEPAMCGNGSRCIALYAKARRIAPSKMAIDTKAGRLSASVRGAMVKINMTAPKGIRLGVRLKAGSRIHVCHHVDTGVPHTIFFTRRIDAIDVDAFGRKIRGHKAFMPEGTNVDFVQQKGKNSLLVRTYERGVESETLACGTGAVASAIIASIVKGYNSPVKVCARGGALNVYFKNKQGCFKEVFLKGEAKEIFTGEIGEE